MLTAAYSQNVAALPTTCVSIKNESATIKLALQMAAVPTLMARLRKRNVRALSLQCYFLILRRREIQDAHSLTFSQSLQQYCNAVLKANSIPKRIYSGSNLSKDRFLRLLLKTALVLQHW